MTDNKDLALLKAAGVFYPHDPEDGAEEKYFLNMNDVWAWATAWGEDVPKEKIGQVATLFRRYGDAGLLYWVSLRHDNMRSEFHDNNRAIDFVRHEEQLRKDVPNSSKRAYTKLTYTLSPEGKP